MKGLVNDFKLYGEFQSFVDGELETVRRSLENHTDVNEMYRLQGEIRVWRRLQKLREKINGR